MLLSSACHAQTNFDSSALHFHSIFAQRKSDKTIYSVLGTGFFRTMRSDDADSKVSSWLANHPHAQVTPVASTPGNAKFGPIVYVWIQSGEDNLNVDLIREGAFPGGVMVDAVQYLGSMRNVVHTLAEGEPKRLVTDSQYRAFLQKIVEAQAVAKANKKGIWADKYEEMRQEEEVQ